MPIEQVQLGQRLVGANPLTEDVELDEPDPALARTVVLEATKPDGQLLHAELIWPVEWIAEVGATVDGQIEVSFGEIETTGTARVVAIGPCPELEPSPGALVIGRYRHELVDAPMVELTLDHDSESVHVTANHPYWSVDRQDFTPAGQLRVGETVDTLSGTAHVAAARSYRYTGTVYNLETTEHVYLVGSSGTLVHNNRNCLLGRNGNRSSGVGRSQVAVDRHHPLPKFLGGRASQILSRLRPKIHREYHSLLRGNLREAGIPLNVGGRGGSTADWARYLRANPGAQRTAFDAVLKAARSVDAKHGTSITQAIWESIMKGRFTPYP